MILDYPGLRRGIGIVAQNTKTNLACLIAISVVWFFFCWPWFVEGKIIPHDAKNHFYPMIRFVAEAWHSGNSFSWSPHHFAGFPMIADPQSAIWTLSLWIAPMISEMPSMRLVDTIHLGHLLVGAFAIFGFGRSNKWRWDSSLASALTYMMAGAVTFRLEHMLMTVSYMWIAIALWRLNAAIQHGGLWRGIVFGFSLAFVLIDRNHVAYLGAWFLLIWWLAAILPEISHKQFTDFYKHHYPIALGGLLALLLVAVPVVLLLQLAQNSNRPEFSYIDASWQSLHPFAMLTFILPEIYGALDGSVRHWGPASSIWGGENLTMHRGMLHMYSGALPIILIVWIGIIRKQILATGIRFFTIASLCFLFYSLGRHTPIFNLLYDYVPGVNLFRRPSDGLFLFGFSISLLTGALFERIDIIKEKSPNFWGLLITVITAAVIGSILFTTANHYDRLMDLARSFALPTGIVASIILAFVLMRRNLIGHRAAVIFVIILSSVDLVYHSTGNRLNSRPPDAYLPLQSTEGHPIYGEIETLLANEDRLGVGWRTEILGFGPVVQNLPQIIGSRSTLGYNPLRLVEFEKYIAPDMQNNASKKRNFGMAMVGYDSDMTNELGIRYIITGAPIETLDTGIEEGHFKLLEKIEHGRRVAHFYENSNALARATLLNGKGSISVSNYANSEIHLQVNSDREDLLVMREFYYPGWTATVNGIPVEIQRSDKLFRAVKVPEGDSNVVFSFEPLRLDNIWNALTQIFANQ